MTIGELKELLADYSDEVEVAVDVEDVLWDIHDVTLVQVEHGKRALRMDW